MDFRQQFGFDKELAEKGKWHDLPGGGRVCVAKLGNPLYKAEIVRLQKPYLAMLRSDKVDNTALIDTITIKAMAKTILTGFTDIILDGEELEYSFENAVYLLTEFPDFREIISELSLSSMHFQAEEIAGK